MIEPNANIAATVKRYYLTNIRKRGPDAPTRGADWARVDKALHGEVSDYILPEDRELEPMTAASAHSRVPAWSGWRPIADELQRLERERRRAASAAPERPAGYSAEEATVRRDTSIPYRIERIATGYQVFCNSTPMQKYETWPEANAEYERLCVELREQRMRTRPATGPAPAFPWVAVPWETTLLEHGLVGPEERAALVRVGPDESSRSAARRQALAWKIWESENPPFWSRHDEEGYRAYKAEQQALLTLLDTKMHVPDEWIGTGPSDVEMWREWESAGMGGVKSKYVAWTVGGDKKHFDTAEERNAWMADNPGSYA